MNVGIVALPGVPVAAADAGGADADDDAVGGEGGVGTTAKPAGGVLLGAKETVRKAQVVAPARYSSRVAYSACVSVRKVGDCVNRIWNRSAAEYGLARV